MASASRPLKLISRLFDFIEKTQVDLFLTPRQSVWKNFGFQDLRGFCPHLRRINLYEDQAHFKNLEIFKKAVEREMTEGRSGEALWLLHDSLHILFYDYATLSLGLEAWTNGDRFLECHLASELFAVLVLDYHALIYTRVAGLAVDLSASDYKKFQKIKPGLPDLESFEFCRALANLYFSGREKVFEPLKTNFVSKGRAISKFSTMVSGYRRWIGHEKRYAKKQRIYIQQWREDLFLEKSSQTEALIETQVAYGVWDLLNLLLYSKENQWKGFLEEINESKTSNYFHSLKKYRKTPKNVDFRFTDSSSLSRAEVKKRFTKISPPNASDLFLMLQVVSLQSPLTLDPIKRNVLIDLSRRANRQSDIPRSLWLKSKREALEVLETTPLKAFCQKDTKATFFLP